MSSFEKFRGAPAPKNQKPAAGDPASPPLAPKAEGLPPADSVAPSPTPAAAAPAYVTKSKPLAIVNDVILHTGQEFHFPTWSPIAINFINKRDAFAGWSFLRSMAAMLNKVGYLPTPVDLPSKFPYGEEKSKYEAGLDEIQTQAQALRDDIQAAMQAKKKEADQAGKQVDNYEAKENFGGALAHFTSEAIRKVSEELSEEETGAGGTTFKFDPTLYSSLFPVPNHKVPEFLTRVSIILQNDNSVIMDINPTTREITLRRRKRMSDGINAIYSAVQKDPEILRLYKDWSPVLKENTVNRGNP